MKIILGASGAGKSTILKLILGLLKPDGGRIIVNGHEVDEMTESDLMEVRARLGMVFQEGALFDSLTVRENVGYRLYEETRPAARRGRRARRRSAGLRRARRIRRADAVGAVGRPAASRRHRARAHVEAGDPALRRADDRARSDHRAHDRRRDHQAARPRRRELDHRHAPAARRVLHRDARGRAKQGGEIDVRAGVAGQGRRDGVPDAERRPHVISKDRPTSCARRTIRTCRSFLS